MDDIKQKVKFEMEMAGLDKIGSDLQSVAAQSDKASGSVTGLSDQFALGALKAQAIGMAVGFVTDMLKAIPQEIENVTRLNAEIYDGAMRAGLLVEEYQALGYVLRESGGSIDDAQRMIRLLNGMLNASSSEGSRQREIIERLGLSYETLRNGTPEQAFYAVTDAVGQLSTAQERNLTLAGLFGARYSQVVSGALNQTNGSIRNASTSLLEQGVIIREDTVAAYDAYSDAQVALQARIEALKSEALLPLIPVLNDNIDRMSDLAEKVIPKVGEALTVLIDGVPVLISSVAGLTAAYTVNLIATGKLTLGSIALIAVKAKEVIAHLAVAAAANAAAIGIGLATGAIILAIIELNKWQKEVEGLGYMQAMSAHAEQANAVLIALTNNTHLSGVQLEHWRTALLSLNQDLPQVRDALALLEDRINGVYDASGNFVKAIGDAGNKAEFYSREQILAAMSTAQLTLSVLQSTVAMKGQAAGIDAQIASTNTWIASLKAALREVGNVSAAGSGLGGSSASTVAAPSYMSQQSDAEFQAWSEAEMERIISLGAEQGMAQAYSFQEAYAAAMADAQPILDADMAAWETRYEIGMHYSGMMVNSFMTEWENGFKGLDKMFGQLMKKMMAEMAASGLLSLASNLLGGGPVGIFGQVFLGGK
jgi:hypothetical protein